MSAGGVLGVRSVAVAVTDLERAFRFYREVWGLLPVERSASAIHLRGTGRYHHILALHQAPRPAIIRIVLAAADQAAIDALHRALAREVSAIEQPGPLAAPGGGYGFGFKDHEGRNFALIAGVADHALEGNRGETRPRKITHVNLNASDRDQTHDFLIRALGFRLIDETAVNSFLCCGSDHHSVVVGQHGMASLNHVAFEMDDLDSVMRGAGRMRDAGYPIEWGVGRHGPGNNVFAYFLGPEDFPLEYTAEVLQVDETYRPRGPEAWRWPPGRLDQWGISDPPSRRWNRIQPFTTFTTDGWRIVS